jgi:hypothetical protein
MESLQVVKALTGPTRGLPRENGPERYVLYCPYPSGPLPWPNKCCCNFSPRRQYNVLKLNGFIQSYKLQFKLSLSHTILNYSSVPRL